VVVALSAPVDCEPLAAKVPDQPPEAVQAVALVEDQVSVELPPLATLVGLALSETVGGAVTETVADCAAEPPAPVHVSVYLVVAVSAAVLWEPLVSFEPIQPPDAVQAVALLDDQTKDAALPRVIELGLALKLTVGAGALTETVADCAALPPVPVQVRV
jgi:hypothetical protein